MKIPAGLEYWTADEIAECLDVSPATYRLLWGIADSIQEMNRSEGETLIKPPAFWTRLTKSEQEDIAKAFKAEQEWSYHADAGPTPQEIYDHENPAPLENPMDWEK